MLVVNRFDVGTGPEQDGFRAELQAVHELLGRAKGYLGGQVGRNLDDPGLWVLTTVWADVGSYRRAISSYDAKLLAVPLLSRAVDEPSAYELVEPGTELNIVSSRTPGAR